MIKDEVIDKNFHLKIKKKKKKSVKLKSQFLYTNLVQSHKFIYLFLLASVIV